MRIASAATWVLASLLHAGSAAAATFTNVSTQSGLRAVEAKTDWWFDLKFEDFDGDGYEDLLWLDHHLVNSAFLLNRHDGTFVDASATAFPDGYGTSSGWNIQPVDFDDDGFVDVLLESGDTGGSSHRNLGNGTFVRANLQGTWDDANGHGSAVADLDGDGYLEILYNRSPRSVVLHRKPDGTFEDVAASLGLDFLTGFSSTFADFTGDGRPDLFTYLCTGTWGLNGEPRLFVNDAHGGFVDGTAASGLAGAPGVAAVAAGDYDEDGDLDLYVTGILDRSSESGTMVGRLYRNDGHGGFTDVTSAAGLPASFASVQVYQQIPMRASWADLDNDGHLDLIVHATGTPGHSGCSGHAFVFRNAGGGTFEDVSAASGLGAICTRQAVMADYDHDGDLDVASLDPGYQLFRNETNDGNWLEVRLAGCSIKTAVGSRVWVYDHGHIGEASYLRGFREVIQANNHETPLEQHFGLSAAKRYDVRVSFYPEDLIVDDLDVAAGQAREIVCAPPNEPALRLSLAFAPGQPQPGDEVTFTLSYKNLGGVTAQGVVLTDPLDAGIELVPGSVSGGGTLEGRVVTWTLGAVAAGASGNVRFAETYRAPHANVASASYGDGSGGSFTATSNLVNVGRLQTVCGNGKCEAGENGETCPADCRGGEPATPVTRSSSCGSGGNDPSAGGAALLAMALGATVRSRRRRNEQRDG